MKMYLSPLVILLLFNPLKIVDSAQVEDKLMALVNYCLDNPEILTKNAFFGINLADAILSGHPLSIKRAVFKQKFNVLREIFKDLSSEEDEFVFDFVVNPQVWKKPQNFSEGQLQALPINISLQTYENILNWGSPDEQQSDECLREIAKKTCGVTKKCLEIESPEGIAFGYHQTHKLIFYMVLNRGNCKVHRKIFQKLCSKILNEVLTIDKLGFPEILRDLAMEQIFLCSFCGFQEFLKPHWIQEISSWQDKSGCFHGNQATCSDHTTGVGAALLALILKQQENALV